MPWRRNDPVPRMPVELSLADSVEEAHIYLRQIGHDEQQARDLLAMLLRRTYARGASAGYSIAARRVAPKPSSSQE